MRLDFASLFFDTAISILRKHSRATDIRELSKVRETVARW